MNQSFYTAALGAGSQQEKLNVVSNNLSNVNTYGFKPKKAVFSNQASFNLNKETEGGKSLRTEVGAALLRTDTDFSAQGIVETGREYDYAITGDGFFAVQDPATQQITYTRNGHFFLQKSGEEAGIDGEGDGYYLVTESGKRVLNNEGAIFEPEVPAPKFDAEEEGYEDYGDYEEDYEEEDAPQIGVFLFAHPSQLQNIGDGGEYAPVEGVTPTALSGNQLDRALLDKHLEMSGTEVAKEFSQLIVSQRAYSYALRMVTTADEVEQTINTLRG